MGHDRLGGRKTLQVDGFLEEFEKEEIKGMVDIVELFGHFGVKLRRKGKGYMGLCPWHEDHEPSLSVDRGKGLYNCFGCGEGGDVVGLVEKMVGVGFKEAMEYLKEWRGTAGPKDEQPLIPEKQGSGSEAAVKEAAAGEVSVKNESEIKKKTSFEGTALKILTSPAAGMLEHMPENLPEHLSEHLPELDLSRVSDYYHSRLYRSKQALEYLERRRLNRGELLGRFGVGFVDGTLLTKVTEGQKEGLKKLGVIGDNGGEHFRDCITVPLHDGSGQTVGFYGRRVGDGDSVKHLRGRHRGIFNRKVSRVYEEIILTESVLDAMSLVELGIENV